MGLFDFTFDHMRLGLRRFFLLLFFFNDTATTEIYTLSLHDALPISGGHSSCPACHAYQHGPRETDRKSTRLNSSHVEISYAVFCLKKKKKKNHCFTSKKKTKKKKSKHHKKQTN